MGGCMSTRNETLRKENIGFTDKELDVLSTLFKLLSHYDSKNGYLTQKSMLPIFKENPDFAVKLFNWMQARSKIGEVDYDTFVITLELLLKDQLDYYLRDYKFRVLEKFDLFALISLSFHECDNDSLNKFTVSYSQGSIVIRELLNTYFFGKEVQNSQKNDLAVRCVSNSLFEQKTSLTYNQFLRTMKTQLLFADRLCKSYFTGKFLNPQEICTLPQLSQASFILNDWILGLLFMSSPVFRQVKQFTKIYSSPVNYDDFDEIAQVVVDAKHSLLFIFRNRENEAQSDNFQQQIFGAFLHLDPLIETHYARRQKNDPLQILHNPNEPVSLYLGDEKSFLFSILPKYQVFLSLDQRSKRAFAYLNSRSFNVKVATPFGLGFGGDGKGNFRIWVDENIKGDGLNQIDNIEASKAGGFLLEPHIKNINLTGIEIWEVKTSEDDFEEGVQNEKLGNLEDFDHNHK